MPLGRLAARDGRVFDNADPDALIANREYRDLSPAIKHQKDGGKVTMIKGAGLVHAPALHLSPCRGSPGRRQADHRRPGRCRVPGAFAIRPRSRYPRPAAPPARQARPRNGPSWTASRATLDIATGKRHAEGDPDPARFAPTETLRAVPTKRNKAQAALREQSARARVDDAFVRGDLAPAMRGGAMALCLSDQASFDLFIAGSVPRFAHLLKPATTSAAPPGFGRFGRGNRDLRAARPETRLAPGLTASGRGARPVTSAAILMCCRDPALRPHTLQAAGARIILKRRQA